MVNLSQSLLVRSIVLCCALSSSSAAFALYSPGSVEKWHRRHDRLEEIETAYGLKKTVGCHWNFFYALAETSGEKINPNDVEKHIWKVYFPSQLPFTSDMNEVRKAILVTTLADKIVVLNAIPSRIIERIQDCKRGGKGK